MKKETKEKLKETVWRIGEGVITGVIAAIITTIILKGIDENSSSSSGDSDINSSGVSIGDQ